jgi:protein-tyrosine phosphatase
MSIIDFAKLNPFLTNVFTNSNSNGQLYVGNLLAANNINILRKYNINTIITLNHNPPESINDIQVVHSHYHYPINDNPGQLIDFDIFQRLALIVDDDLKNGINVLVHCYAGISRSTTFILFYLMHQYRDQPLRKLLQYLKDVHPITSPNKGFIKQLQDLEIFIKKNSIVL